MVTLHKLLKTYMIIIENADKINPKKKSKYQI